MPNAAQPASRCSTLLGEWDFMDFTLKVGPGVLCPRADSEIVCESALALLQGRERPVVYDLCAGTGCLGLGIARHSPGALVTCVEKSPEALALPDAPTRHRPVCAAVQADVFTYYKTLPAEGARPDHLQPTLPDRGGDAGTACRKRRRSLPWRWTAARTGWISTAC